METYAGKMFTQKGKLKSKGDTFAQDKDLIITKETLNNNNTCSWKQGICYRNKIWQICMAYKTNILIGDRHLNRSKRNLFNSFIQKQNFETKLAEILCIKRTSKRERCIFFAYGLPKQNKDFFCKMFQELLV